MKSSWRRVPLAMLAAAAIFVIAATAADAGRRQAAKNGGTLTVGLAEDPDALDPTLARTFVGRMVFLAICEKLYDLNSKLQIVPQLAAGLPKVSANKLTVTIKIRKGIRFNDGTPLNAQAVKISLDRHKTLTGSRRASEISPVTSVDAVGSDTVRIHLNEPFAPLTAQLADRAGMIMSPAQLDKLGTRFATNPVCVGPFRYQDRVPLDHITVTKSPFYYARSKVHLDKILFRIINEPTAAAAALRAHDIDVLDRIGSTVLPSIRANKTVHVIQATSIGYQGITINIGNKNGLLKLPYQNVGTDMAAKSAIRQAFELAIDRTQLNRVVFQGTVKPSCSPLSEASPYFDGTACNLHRDLKRARAAVARSGIRNPTVKLMIGNDSDALRLGQFLQAEEEAAGIRVQLQPTEFVSSLAKADGGQYDSFAIGWSGRIDPDGNIYQFVATKGSQNDSGYANPRLDVILNNARHAKTLGARKTLYRAAVRIIRNERPLIYLWHPINRHGVTNTVTGVKVYGDGLIRAEFAQFK